MKKMHTTTQQKSLKEQLTFKIKTDYSKIPNKMHLDAQISYPARVHEDKRFKKPKHKNKSYDLD